jgi:hypothetical protein
VPQVRRSDSLATPPRERHPAHRPWPRGTRPRQRPEAVVLIVSVSAVLLLGVVVYLLWRYARLPLWQAATCALFGYLLAASSLGPHIANGLQNLAHFIARLHL